MEGQYNNDKMFSVPYAGPEAVYANARVIVNHKGVHYYCEMVDVDTNGQVQFDFMEHIHQTYEPAMFGVRFGDCKWYIRLDEFVIEQGGKRYLIYGDNVKVSLDGKVTLVEGESYCVETPDPITPDVFTHDNLYQAAVVTALKAKI